MADYISQFTGSEIDSRLAKVPQIESALEGKQATLVSGMNIKTVNGQSVLGSGNIEVQAGDTDAVKYVSQTLTEAQKTQARTNIGGASAESVAAETARATAAEEDIMDAVDGTNAETVTVLPAASASTVGKFYYVGPDGSGEYARYRGIESGGSYSFLPVGTTEMNLSTYATQAEVSQLEQEVGDVNKFMQELVKNGFSKEVVNFEIVAKWPFNLTTGTGKYGTNSTYEHTRIFVRPGDLVEIVAQSESSGARFCFLSTATKPVSGAVIDLVTGTSITELAAGESVLLKVPSGAVAIAIYLGASPTYSYLPNVTIWRVPVVNPGSMVVPTFQADLYRPTSSVQGRNGESGLVFPVVRGRTYLINITRNPSGTIYSAFIYDLPFQDGTDADYVTRSSFVEGIIKYTPQNDGFYYITTQNSATLGVQVTEMLPETAFATDGGVEKDFADVAKSALAFAEVDINSLPLRDYSIDETYNIYGLVSTYKHILVPVTGGDWVYMKKGDNALVYAWLVSDETPVAGALPAFLPGTARCRSDEDVLVKVPSGASFLLIYLYNGASTYPAYVGISTDEQSPTPTPEDEDVVVRGDGGANSRLFLNQERPYYFAQGWGADDDYGHLDKMLSLVPEGRHFISFTDIHLDYDSNFGLRQKQASVMRYVQERLRDCRLVFMGDVIGNHSAEETEKKELSWFTDEYYGLFGEKFIPTIGDHDTEYMNDGVLDKLSNQYLVDVFFKYAYLYGATGDTLGIEAIDDVTFSDVPETDATKKAAWKAYMKMHYFVDDKANKIRFLVIEQGAAFRDVPARYNVPGESLYFICNALQSTPDDYDVVVIAHEYQFEMRSETETTGGLWDAKLFEVMAAFKNRTSFTLTSPYYSNDEERNVWAAIEAKYGSSAFDFSGKTGVVFAMSGDKHYDMVCYWNYSTRYTHFAVDYTPAQADILWVTQDRASLNQNPGFQASWASNIPEMLKAFRRAKVSVGDSLIGTTDEVLFDVFTINEDGLTITRFGDTPVAGRAGLYPPFDEAESYAVGDIVIWYEMVGDQYAVKAFRFKANHSPGAFNASEVDEFIVTEPYVRNFTF